MNAIQSEWALAAICVVILPLAAMGQGLSRVPLLAMAQDVVEKDESTFAFDLFIAGGSKIVWIGQMRHDRDASVHDFRLSYATLKGPLSKRFLVFWPYDIIGQPHEVCLQGDALHIFFKDGSHKVARPNKLAEAVAPRNPLGTQVNLPDQALPESVCASFDSRSIFAVIRSSRIRNLLNASPDRDLQIPEDELPTFGIVRTDGSAWTFLGYLPAAITDKTVEIETVAGPEDLYLLAREKENEQNWGVWSRSISAAEETESGAAATLAWSQHAQLDRGPGSSILAFDATADGLFALSAAPEEYGGEVTVVKLDKDQWSSVATLEDEQGAEFRFDGRGQWTFGDAEIQLASVDETEQVLWQTWDFETGEPVNAPVVVSPLSRATPTGTSMWTRRVLEFFLLPATLIIIFLWRREQLGLPVSMPEGVDLAQFSARMSAFMIDTIILMPVNILVLVTIFDVPELLENPMLIFNASATQFPELFWFRLPVTAVYCIYGTAFETIKGATPGKLAVGIRVMGENQKPPGLVRAFVRNVLRIVDFIVPPVLLVALFTQNRQRIGDALGFTVVVGRRSLSPSDRGNEAGGSPDQDR